MSSSQFPYTPPTVAEAIASIQRAYERGADYLIIDNRQQRWLWEAAELGVSEGLLEEPTEVSDDQWSELRYRFTKKGRGGGDG